MTLFKRLLLLSLLLLPFAATAQDSQSDDDDRGFLTRLIEDNLSGEGRTVKLEGFHGALSSRATFDLLTISDDNGPWLTIRNAAIQWNRAALLRKRIELKELTADEIDLPRLPPSSGTEEKVPDAEASGFSLPSLPVAIQIDKIDAKKVHLGAPVMGQDVSLNVTGSAKLAGGDGDIDLKVDRLDGPRGQISVAAGYTGETGDTHVDLLVDEAKDGIVANLIKLPGAPAIQLAVNGSGPISDFSADVALTTDNQPRLTGKVALHQTKPENAPEDSTQMVQGFSVQLGGDIAPLFVPEYQAFFGDNIELEAEGSKQPDGSMQLSKLDLTSRALSLNGVAAVGADGVPTLAQLQAKVGLSDETQEVMLPVGSPTWLRHADINLDFDAAKSDDWKLSGIVDGFRRDDISLDELNLDGSGQITAAKAEDGSTGTAFSGAVKLLASGFAATDQALSQAVGSTLTLSTDINTAPGAPVKLSNLKLDGADYGLAGDLTFNGLDDALEIAGDVTAHVADASRFAQLAGQPISGAAEAHLKGSYGVLAGTFDAQADITGDNLGAGIPQADALLSGRSAIHLDAARDQSGTTLRSFTLRASTLSAEASGALSSKATDLTAKVDFSDLSAMGAPYAGQGSLTAKVTGTGDNRDFTVDGTTSGLVLGIPQLDGLLKAKTTLAVAGTQNGKAITLSKALVNNQSISLDAGGTYNPGASDLTAKIDFPDLGVMGAAYGGGLKAEAHLTESGTAEAPVRQISLTGDASGLRVGVPDADKLLAGATKIDIAATEDAGVVEIQRLNLSNPQLDVSGNGTATGEGQQLKLDATLNNLGLIVPQLPGPLTIKGTVDALGAKGYRTDLALQAPGGTSATIAGTAAADFATMDLAVKGSAQAAIANAFIAPQNVSGPVSFDLRLSGPPNLSAVSGTISTSGARVSIPAANLQLEALRASISLANGRAQLDTRANIAAGGSVRVSGPVTLSAPFNGDLTIALTNAVLRDPALYETSLNGNLSINGPLAGGAKIAGTINLGETNLRVPSTSIGGAGSVDGLQHRNASSAVNATLRRADMLSTGSSDSGGAASGGSSSSVAYGLDVRLNAPNRIFVRGRGLDAELGGQLRILGTTANVQPQGQFELVRGRLNILSQRFDLDEGLIQMQGSLVPTITFKAVTQTTNDEISIVIEGPASDPQISFVSASDLPQEEVLSQLLFGRDVSSISAFQAAQLASAVAELAGKGGDGIVSKLRQGFGLDDLDVTTDENGKAAVQAGRYISDNVYTNVTVGSQGTSAISLNLDVTKSITLRGEAEGDGNTSVGVFFQKDY